MKFNLLLYTICAIFSFTFNPILAQAPDLGAASSFAVFTGDGAFTNEGATVITGDIGTNVGALTGFPPGIVIGEIHVADTESAAAATAVADAYGDLAALTCGQVIGTTLGNGQVLTPGIYCTGAATSLNGSLILDGENDPDALFIFLIDGALSTSVLSNVVLINGATPCNVWWQINGAFSLGEGSVFRGNALVNGAISLLEGSSLYGRALATVGAIDLHNNTVNIASSAMAPVITADGPTTFCMGDSVVLSGNNGGVWNTGDTTSSITVFTSGDFFVTVNSSCGSDTSNIIQTTVNPLPDCTITGDASLCEGQSTELCAPAGEASYLWSTGETTNCITVNTAGDYSVTVTDNSGCVSTCTETVTIDSVPLCTISGERSFCEGQSTELCVPAGEASYLWSTGETTNCITVNTTGDYSVTVTDNGGCVSTCSATVTIDSVPVCIITGDTSICEGESTELCAPAGEASYLWSTGETTNCITVNTTGDYSVTVTDTNGCTSSCSQSVTNTDVAPNITCPSDVTIECDESDLPSNTGMATATNACDLPMTITYSDSIVAGLCPQESVITRTWTVTVSPGNSSSCTQQITIVDITLPLIICPADISIECNESTLSSNTGIAMATDNCDISPVVSFSDSLIPGTCPDEYLILRSWLVLDDCGNSATCEQLITVLSNTPPVITIVNPILTANNDTAYVQCYGQDPVWDLPQFDENDVEVSSICGGNMTVDYSRTLLDEGDCEGDGYILLYRLTWTATDLCGNSSSAFVFLALVDTIAPVIYGVPADTTVNCDAIPELPSLVYATDECLCACVVLVQESQLPSGCQNGQVLLRTWTASDRCGNETVVTQRITVVDDEGPLLTIIEPELAGLQDGSILEYFCSEGGIPDFLGSMNAQSVSSTGTCGSSDLVTFRVDTRESLNCEFYGFKEERTYQWKSRDECGYETTLTIVARLIDNEAPVLVGLPEITCIGDPALQDIFAIYNCGQAFTHFYEVNIPNPCGSGMAIKRTYEAYDACGNITIDSVILIPNDQISPTMEYVTPLLINLLSDEIIVDNCEAQGGRYTSFGVEDVILLEGCDAGVEITFSERLLETGDCTEGEAVAVVELQWTATDICGNSGVLTLLARVVDDASPSFVNFQPEMTIGCNDRFPSYYTRDNCSDVTITTHDSIIESDCDLEFDIHRLVTATDLCGNSITRSQIIHVGDGRGPVIKGVRETVCNDLTIPYITAYDDCSGTFVEVTMEQDTVDVPCRDGLVIERTWTAVDICGNATVIPQTIIMHDQTPPEILIPYSSVINYIQDNTDELILLSLTDIMHRIDNLNESSVIVSDECDQDITPVLTVTVLSGDCRIDGYSERRVYTWVATDDCGNSSSVSVTLDIMDDMPPEMLAVPADTMIVCVDLPIAPEMLVDSIQGETMVYTQVINQGGNSNEFIVTRTWIATDLCGNTKEVVQRIVWIPEGLLECEIFFPEVIECNSHGVTIGSVVTGVNSSYTYEWEVVGEKCFIQGGQGTPEIKIYMGWEDAKIILTVTDTFGCVSMCMVTLHCDLTANSILNPPDQLSVIRRSPGFIEPGADLNTDYKHGETLTQLKSWPNPANGNITLSFESAIDQQIQFTLMNTFGQAVISEQIQAARGFNTGKVNLEHLFPGSYLIQVNTGGELHTRVLVIQRGN